jgi:hypothetical protein
MLRGEAGIISPSVEATTLPPKQKLAVNLA